MTIQYTPLSALPYPQPTDPADLPAHLKSLAEAADGRTVLRFADAAARDAKVTAPAAGMIAWIGNPGRLMYYTGSAWVPVAPVPVFRANLDDGDTTSLTYTETLANSAGGALTASFTVPASGQVVIGVGSYTRCSAASAIAFMGVNLRNAAGTVVNAAADAQAAASPHTGRTSVATQFLVTGLAVGTVLTATAAYRSSVTGNTAYFDSRYLRIDPIP
ncbi:hypothetical protein GCM10010387_04570 [Streptomyces inusitatus]|uniref:Uncharacterized protein n=1 Tax=Streptomyces inusitatus TaxID=68221 RepID=A0A918PLU0_9ACTN|nr:hypothetical protein [Streptomyces inusitatus]GGZ15336.1 hypothetical protein GCM10010387_04570 [Streptomyces inusitatus]